MTKVALGLHTWVITCVRKPKNAFVGKFLCTQLRFQKHKKGKFSSIMAEVWNESHIVWESFQTPFFPLYKALHGTFSKHTEITWKNLKFTKK